MPTGESVWVGKPMLYYRTTSCPYCPNGHLAGGMPTVYNRFETCVGAKQENNKKMKMCFLMGMGIVGALVARANVWNDCTARYCGKATATVSGGDQGLLSWACPEGSVLCADRSSFDAATGVFCPQWQRPPTAEPPKSEGGHLEPRRGGMLWRAGAKKTYVVEFDSRFVELRDCSGRQLNVWHDWMKYTVEIGPDPITFVGGYVAKIHPCELPSYPEGVRLNTPLRQDHAEILWTKPICKEPNRYPAWPTICRRKNGELLVAFSGDRVAHVSPDGKVQLIRSNDNGETWSAPATIVDGVLDDRDGGILELDDGTLILKYFTSINFTVCDIPAWNAYYDGLSEADVLRDFGSFVRRSTDGGLTWGPAIRTVGSTPHGPVKMKDGSILLVATQHHFPKSGKPANVFDDEPSIQTVETSSDGGLSWQKIAEIPDNPPRILAKDLCEPTAIDLGGGRIVAMLRWETDCCHLIQSESSDGGKTWSAPWVTDIDGFPPHLLQLDDGGVLCTYSSRRDGRWGEYARISRDGCKTWNAVGEIKLDGLPLETTSYGVDFGYPSTVRLSDGSFLTAYYRAAMPGESPSIMLTKWMLK